MFRSSRMAFCGSKSECERYVKSLEHKKETEAQDLDDQFKGVTFE
jgi:hypothetical protein